MLSDIIEQADRQEQASAERPIIYFVDERPLAIFLRNFFRDGYPKITVDWLPMPRGAK